MALLMAEPLDRRALPPTRLGRGLGHDDGGVGGEPTLDDAIVGAWEGLTAQVVAVACPLCEEGMLRPRPGAGGAAALGGRCDRCGTTLV